MSCERNWVASDSSAAEVAAVPFAPGTIVRSSKVPMLSGIVIACTTGANVGAAVGEVGVEVGEVGAAEGGVGAWVAPGSVGG